MTCSPPHPHLLLDRPMTEREMYEALNYEGAFGIGELDLSLAQKMAAEGKIICELWDKGRGWHVCSNVGVGERYDVDTGEAVSNRL